VLSAFLGRDDLRAVTRAHSTTSAGSWSNVMDTRSWHR
jgi:hypothetical protein